MKSSVPNSIFTSIMLAFLFFFIACDKEVIEKEPHNYINILEKEYKINNVMWRSTGQRDLIFNDNQQVFTHYEYFLLLSDGTITWNGPSAENATYLVVLQFYTTIKDHDLQFTGGTFDAVSTSDFYNNNSPTDKDFFTVFLIRIDQNGDSKFSTRDNDKFVDGTNGQVSVTVTGDNFTVTFKNKTTPPDPITPITGGYTGVMEVIVE